MPPKPTMPSVLPASSRPLESAGRGHSPLATAADDAYAPRSRNIAVPITYSATASALAPVAGMTSIPRFLQASTSMLSRPTPSRPTTLSAGAAGEQPRVDLRAVAHDQRIGRGHPGPKLVGAIDEALVVERFVLRGQPRDRGLVHEFADDDAHGATDSSRRAG